LRTLLRDLYPQLLGHHRGYLLAHPNGEAYTGLIREIQMRQALLEDNIPSARSRAAELTSYLTAHPPPAEGPNRPETKRWDLRALRSLSQDPEFAQLARGIDAPSATENTVALLNGISLEILQALCATLDQVNEESVATITARYRALASVAGLL